MILKNRKHNVLSLNQIKAALLNSIDCYEISSTTKERGTGSECYSVQLSFLRMKIPIFIRKGAISKSMNDLGSEVVFQLDKPWFWKWRFHKYYYDVKFEKDANNRFSVIEEELFNG